jgi:3-methyladenine DNA glycosylase Mpg
MEDAKLTKYLGLKTTDEQIDRLRDEARLEDRRSISEMTRVLIDEALDARAKGRAS